MKKIIIINEDLDFCRTYEEAFRIAGFDVEVCHDGKVGLARALSQRPDVVVLGIMLPTLNGLDVLRVLRRRETTKNTPVFVCSRLSGEEIQEVKHLGATAFFPKSTCTPKILLTKIQELMG